MLLTETNLHTVGASGDKGSGYDCIFLLRDGTTAATDGKHAFVLAEPSQLNPKRYKTEGVKPVKVSKGGVSIPKKAVLKVLSNLPKGASSMYRTAVLTKCEAGRVELTTSDPAGAMVLPVNVPAARVPAPNHRAVLKGVTKRKARVCINLKALRGLLQVVEKMCGGDARQPVFIELGDEEDPVLVRGKSFGTKQMVLGIVMPVEDPRWPSQSEWEEGLYGSRKVAIKRRIAVRRRATRRED